MRLWQPRKAWSVEALSCGNSVQPEKGVPAVPAAGDATPGLSCRSASAHVVMKGPSCASLPEDRCSAVNSSAWRHFRLQLVEFSTEEKARLSRCPATQRTRSPDRSSPLPATPRGPESHCTWPQVSAESSQCRNTARGCRLWANSPTLPCSWPGPGRDPLQNDHPERTRKGKI